MRLRQPNGHRPERLRDPAAPQPFPERTLSSQQIGRQLPLLICDAKTGQEAWSTDTVPESLGLGAMANRYSITMAPRVAKGKVFIGGSGGEFGVRGWIAAYDADTGKEVWRFNTVAGPGEAGSES